jgi:predicted PolB exonuclease-like 3'-5' exonuclease
MRTITLDIETIPDAAALTRIGDPGDGFLPWPLHALACVSLFTVDSSSTAPWRFAIQTFSRADLSERAILSAVEDRIGRADQVVTFNGRGFDAPVLMARAAVTGVPTPTIAQLHGRGTRPHFHLDLLDEVCGGRSAPRIRLAHLCATFDIPVKLEAAGDDVAALAAAGAWDRIGRYCETDVVATWLALQAWRGSRQPDERDLAWRSLAEWIERDQPNLAHLLPYAAPAELTRGASLGIDQPLPYF